MRKLITDLKENEVIHCSTEKEAIAICKLMHEAGLKWCSGRSYLEEHSYFLFKENTCYYPKTGEYASIDWYKNGNYTIYKASDFLTSIYEVGKEYEFSDNEKEWCKRNYLCITSKGLYVCEAKNGNAESWKFIRKINTEKEQALETIKELMNKHGIKKEEL